MTSGVSYFLGIDLGTSGCKTVALGVDGMTLASAEGRYPMSAPRPGWAEQDPDLWWGAVQSSVKLLREQLPSNARPLGVGATGQMHSLVPLDARLQVIRPAILWCDQRSETEAAKIADKIGSEAIMRITKNPSRAAFTASKILWLRNNEPDSASRLTHVSLPKDWLIYRLTGRLVTEPSDASGTGLFDVARSTWSAEILAGLNLSPTLFPTLLSSDTIVGTVNQSAAAFLGLPSGLPVIAGAGDQAAAAFDAGATSEGVVACNLGTSVALTESVSHPVNGVLSHVVPGQWLYLTSAHSGTMALDWWSRIAGNGLVSDIVHKASSSVSGANGARFVPLLLGSRDKTGRNSAGSFHHLRADHEPSDLARAVLEGIALEIRRIAENLPSADTTNEKWRVFGGGSRGALFVQIVADVLQKPLQIIANASSARGAARLLGTALEIPIPDVATARARIIPHNGFDYDAVYEEYRGEVA